MANICASRTATESSLGGGGGECEWEQEESLMITFDLLSELQ